MTIRRHGLVVGIALGLLLLSVNEASGQTSASSPTVSAEAAQLAALVNAARVEHDLQPLAASSTLSGTAQHYADWMAESGFFRHRGPDGQSPLAMRLDAAGYDDWTYVGETLAGGQRAPERVVAAWLASGIHREIVLQPEAREIGTGFSTAAGGPHRRYWVMHVGARAGRQIALSGRFGL